MDGSLHKVLKRQIKKYLGDDFELSPKLDLLFKAVSDTYTHSDEDRDLVNYAMDVSSKEFLEINTNLKKQQAVLAERTGEVERINALMVDREMKMIELKEENKKIKEQLEIIEQDFREYRAKRADEVKEDHRI